MILRFIKYYWKTIVWAILVFIASSISGDNLNKVKIITIPHFDKFVHFSLYFGLAVLLIIAIKKDKRTEKLPLISIASALLITIGYSIIMELLQFYFFVSRSMEMGDAITNTIGAIIGMLLVVRVKKIRTLAVKYL